MFNKVRGKRTFRQKATRTQQVSIASEHTHAHTRTHAREHTHHGPQVIRLMWWWNAAVEKLLRIYRCRQHLLQRIHGLVEGGVRRQLTVPTHTHTAQHAQPAAPQRTHTHTDSAHNPHHPHAHTRTHTHTQTVHTTHSTLTRTHTHTHTQTLTQTVHTTHSTLMHTHTQCTQPTAPSCTHTLTQTVRTTHSTLMHTHTHTDSAHNPQHPYTHTHTHTHTRTPLTAPLAHAHTHLRTHNSNTNTHNSFSQSLLVSKTFIQTHKLASSQPARQRNQIGTWYEACLLYSRSERFFRGQTTRMAIKFLMQNSN